MQNDWNKYGEDAFEFLVLEECEEIDLNQYERKYFEQYDVFNKGYNQNNVNRYMDYKLINPIMDDRGYYNINLCYMNKKKRFCSKNKDTVIRKAIDWIEEQKGSERYEYNISLSQNEFNMLQTLLEKQRKVRF